MIASFTGHRPDKLGGYGTHEPLTALATWWLEALQPDTVISGMALGWDQAVAEAATRLGVPWCAAVPFEGQENRWPDASRAQYQRLLARAGSVVIVSPGGYSARKMHWRNEWMVDQSDLLCALWDGSDGGTGACVRYAERVGRLWVNLWSEWRGSRCYD